MAKKRVEAILKEIIKKAKEKKDEEEKEKAKEEEKRKEQKKKRKEIEKKEKKEKETKKEKEKGKVGEKEIEKKKKEERIEKEEVEKKEIFAVEVEKPRFEIKKIPRITTGIPGFDEMLGGGFEEKSILLLNGDPGSGKTIFGLQFLNSAAMRGEATLYIAFGGEPKDLLYARMADFGMNFKELEERRLFFMIEYQPHEVAKLMQEEGGTIYDIVTTYGVKKIVIDPVTPYLIQYSNPYDVRLALVRLVAVVRRWSATTLFLSEKTEEAPHPSVALAEFYVDSVINLIHQRSSDGIQIRGIEIWKACGIDHSEIARPFAFTPKGIVVYPTERLFTK